jgi:hypothetical protein
MYRTYRWLAAAAAGITVAGAVACTGNAAPTAATATGRAASITTAPAAGITTAMASGKTTAPAAGKKTAPPAPPAPAVTLRGPGPCGMTTTALTYQHVIWIWFENHDVMGSSSAPYFNSIASKCGVATNDHNVTHPSLPNYIAATSGTASLEQFYSDCPPSDDCSSSAPSIFGQGETWKAYEESMPSNCDQSNTDEYATRHNPPAYYPALTACAANDVPYSQLATDLASNKLPAFSFITPNLIDDMHDGTVAQGDAWLSSNLPTILHSPEYTSGSTVVFVTFDEGADNDGGAGENCVGNTDDSSCHVPAIVISPSTPAGSTSATLFSHYSLLATTEQLLRLPALGQAASAATMTAAFNL